VVETRARIGDWEADTILGPEGNRHCLLSLVERKTGYLVLGKLTARTTAEVNRRAAHLIQRQPHPVRTITTDNGTEFHGYAALEAVLPARFYFATPHHAPAPALRRPRGGGRRHLVPLLQSGPAGPLR
jgi:IS30 family transposase